MKPRFLTSALVAALALIVLDGCAPPTPVAESTGASDNSSRGDARTESNATFAIQPHRIEPPAEAEMRDSAPVAISQPNVNDRSRENASTSNDRAPSKGSLDRRSSGGGAAAKNPSSTKEFKLEFVSATGEVGLEPGDTIPNIEGKDLDGIQFQLSDYQGKVIMIDFWGDW